MLNKFVRKKCLFRIQKIGPVQLVKKKRMFKSVPA